MSMILRDAGLSRLLESDGVERLADGFEFTEGPLWLPDGTFLFQDIKAEKTHSIGPDRSVRTVREKTEAANGQTFLPDGRIVFCEQNGRRVSTMSSDGSTVHKALETWQGKRLNSPNDVVCRGDGQVYFTDPPYGVDPAHKEIPFQGVYRWRPTEPGDEALSVIVDDFEKPNGLAFSPDEATLYICDTARYHVRSFQVEPEGGLVPGSGKVFCTLDPGENGGPDGMKVDAAGRVYVAVALGIWVFEPDGQLLGILSIPKRPSNLNWCEPDAKGLFITVVDAVYYARFREPGLLPKFTPASPVA